MFFYKLEIPVCLTLAAISNQLEIKGKVEERINQAGDPIKKFFAEVIRALSLAS
jgi:hypothetical protein